MKVTYLTHLQFHLISLIDENLHQGIDFEDIYAALKRDNLLDWLSERFPELDLSLYTSEDGKELTYAIDGLTLINARRKFSVERNGICLLMAMVNELIQQKTVRV